MYILKELKTSSVYYVLKKNQAKRKNTGVQQCAGFDFILSTLAS